MIPQDFIQTLLARTDIVDVIEPHVRLKKSGANYFGCCPFHDEKSASFSVSPSKQFYHCFGCGAHGSAISFMMEYRGLSFPDAVADLASISGLSVPHAQGRRDSPQEGRHVQITSALGQAALYYHEQLLASPRAMDYLARRGLDLKTIEQFAIGYAPDGWQNLKACFGGAYDDALLVDAGMTLRHESGRLYDRFRDRIMFPIVNESGALIAFGGRVLDKGEPKYLNSPETLVFDKGRELYGLHDARDALRKEGYALAVEGYMDVIALAQHGINNAVATLGTAMSAAHAAKLFRYSDRIVFCFDGDNAGRTAAWRALERSLESLTDTRALAFLFLPEGHDPDSFVQERGPEALRTLAAQAMPMSQFIVQTLQQRHPSDTAEGRARLAHEAKQFLAALQAPMLRLQLIEEVARIAQCTPDSLAAVYKLSPPSAQPPRRTATRTEAAPKLGRTPPEQLLSLCLDRPARALRLPMALLEGEQPVVRALLALHDAVDIGDISEDAASGMVREYFREHGDFALFDAAASAIMSEEWLPDEENDSLFNSLVASLVKTDIGKEIERLLAKGKIEKLTQDERRELNALLLQQRGSKPPQPGL